MVKRSKRKRGKSKMEECFKREKRKWEEEKGTDYEKFKRKMNTNSGIG